MKNLVALAPVLGAILRPAGMLRTTRDDCVGLSMAQLGWLGMVKCGYGRLGMLRYDILVRIT